MGSEPGGRLGMSLRQQQLGGSESGELGVSAGREEASVAGVA